MLEVSALCHYSNNNNKLTNATFNFRHLLMCYLNDDTLRRLCIDWDNITADDNHGGGS